jgi:hypothetical protein
MHDDCKRKCAESYDPNYWCEPERWEKNNYY